MVTVGNGVLFYLWRCKVGTTDCCLLPSVEGEYISQVFKWLVMKGIDKGGPFNRLWSVGDAEIQGISKGMDCIVLVMPWSLLESDRSWGEEVHIFLTIKMPGRNCHVSVLEDVSIRNPPLKGTAHKLSLVTRLGNESTNDRGLTQIQKGAVESIRKCSLIIDVEGETRGDMEGTVLMAVNNHLGVMSFIIKMRITVAVIERIGQTLNMYTEVTKNQQFDCFLREADGDKWSQLFDDQNASKAIQSVIDEVHYPKFSDSLWETEIFGRGIECQKLSPFYYSKINCKMKFFQSRYSKNHMMLLNLPRKQMRMVIVEAREIKLIMMLRWGIKVLSIFEFKAAWRKNINAETVNMRATCVNTIKSMIEWMIAWWVKSVLG